MRQYLRQFLCFWTHLILIQILVNSFINKFVIHNQKLRVESGCYRSRTGIFQNLDSGGCGTGLNR